LLMQRFSEVILIMMVIRNLLFSLPSQPFLISIYLAHSTNPKPTQVSRTYSYSTYDRSRINKGLIFAANRSNAQGIKSISWPGGTSSMVYFYRMMNIVNPNTVLKP